MLEQLLIISNSKYNKYLKGSGKQPVTWVTLVETSHDSELSVKKSSLHLENVTHFQTSTITSMSYFLSGIPTIDQGEEQNKLLCIYRTE